MTCSSDASRTNVITDQNGKTFIFKKRKGKIMDFLDILIQAKVEKLFYDNFLSVIAALII